MLKSNPLRINVTCWTCSHLLFDEFPLFKNPWNFSLGFLFEPRLIAGRVGFRVSDGVSGVWSPKNWIVYSETQTIFLEVARTDSLVKELSSWPRGWMWGQHGAHGYGPVRWSLGAWGGPIIWHWPSLFLPEICASVRMNCSIATCNHHSVDSRKSGSKSNWVHIPMILFLDHN